MRKLRKFNSEYKRELLEGKSRMKFVKDQYVGVQMYFRIDEDTRRPTLDMNLVRGYEHPASFCMSLKDLNEFIAILQSYVEPLQQAVAKQAAKQEEDF